MIRTAERIDSSQYVQASLWSSNGVNENGHSSHEHPENVFGPDFEMIAVPSVVPAVSPTHKHFEAIRKALELDKEKIEQLYAGMGLDYEKLREHIATDNVAKKSAKIGVRDELATWLVDNDQDLQRTASGRKRRTVTAVERAARRQAAGFMRGYNKNPEAFSSLAAKAVDQPDQQQILSEIWDHIGIFHDESKRLNKKHRQASYYLRDAIDLLIWNDYLSYQGRIDRDFQQAQRLHQGTKQYVNQFNYYDLFPARKSQLDLGIAKTNLVLTTFDLLVPKEVRLNKRGRDRLRKGLVEFAQSRAGSMDSLVYQASLDEIAQGNNKMLWRIGMGLGLAAGGLAVAMASLDAVTNQSDSSTSDVSLSAPQQDGIAQDTILTVVAADSPTEQLAAIAHENVIVDIAAIPQIAETITELVELPSGRTDETIDYSPVDLPEMTIPRAAEAILKAEQAASFDPTIQLSPANIDLPEPHQLPKVVHIEVFGDNQPPTEIKLPVGSNTWIQVQRHLIEWMAKFNRQPSDKQIIAAVSRALADSKIGDPYNLAPGYLINLSGVNEIMAKALAENPAVPVVPSAPARAAATVSGAGRLGITQQMIEDLRLSRDGRRYSCMELLDAIEASFADLGPGKVATMNGIAAAEASCDNEAISYAGSMGAPQIHKGSHQKWVEARFGKPFFEVVRNPWTAFQVARQIYDWQGFEAWDVCGLGYKKFIKPVLDCLRLTR